MTEDHVYLSTSCLHEEHAYCQGKEGLAGEKVPAQCKFCGAPCICSCHRAGAWVERDIVAPATGAEREAVTTAQRALRVPETGELDAATQAALRGVQRLFKLEVTGVLDKATAAALDRLRPPSLRE